MINREKFKESVDFTSRYFEEGAYTPKILFKSSEVFRDRKRSALRWVAACIAGVTLTATAVLVIYQVNSYKQSPTEVQSEHIQPTVAIPVDQVIHLEFSDASLADVVKGVEDAYGVKLYNVPEEDMYLTLSYEGNAEDFVSAVNDVLGTDIKIER